MTNFKWFKFSLDILMAIVFALLFNTRVISGLSFHEIAGLAISGAFLVHLLLSWRWIKQVSVELFSNKLKGKIKFGYLLNVILLLAMGYVIVSGVLISRYLFPNLGLGNERIFKGTHIAVSYLTLMLLGIHLGLHWDWVMNMFKRMIGKNQDNKVFGYAAKAAVVLVLLFGVYNIYSAQYFNKLSLQGGGYGSHEGVKGERGFNGAVSDQGGRTKGQNRGFDGDQNSPDNFRDGGAPGGKGFSGSEQGLPSNGKGFPRGQEGFTGERGFGSANVLGVLVENLGIIAIFTLITYYLEKFFFRKKD